MKRLSDKQKRRLMRKAKQLAAADLQRRAGKDPKTREVHVKATAGKDAIFFATRTGYFSPRSGPLYTLADLDIADCLDTPGKMVEVCAKLGFTVLAQVFRYTKPAAGQAALTELAEVAAKWMGMDIEAVKAELAAEKAEAAADATPGPTSEPTGEAGESGTAGGEPAVTAESLDTTGTPGQPGEEVSL